MQSVSSWIAQFKPDFPAHFIAERHANKIGKTKEWVLDKWERKKDISLHQGNWVHESIEYYLKYDPDFRNAPVEEFIRLNGNDKVYSEVIVHDDTYAGTIDIIKPLEKGKVKLIDFKTNEDLQKKNGKLKDKFSHLDNTPFNCYNLQLWKYKELLEKMKDVEVVEQEIWWWNDNKFEIIKINFNKLWKPTLKSLGNTTKPKPKLKSSKKSSKNSSLKSQKSLKN